MAQLHLDRATVHGVGETKAFGGAHAVGSVEAGDHSKSPCNRGIGGPAAASAGRWDDVDVAIGLITAPVVTGQMRAFSTEQQS